ncbi:MAG TPA: D-glycero-beta-D-manno-heptose 1-phosphate adenylyltransferase [Candidatus Obscuribacterales bacterium]
MPNRILDRQDLARIAAEIRTQGKRVVATNGCFDILHAGHVRYLERARELGDVLIVGINSDDSVRKLKGANRPINSEQDRAEVLSALRCVDFVSVFSEETAAEFLRACKPQIYAKGGDYTPETLPETPVIKECGGEVVILDLVPGKSTTSTISRIQNT